MNARHPEPDAHLAMDDTSDWALRFVPIRSNIPDLRAPASHVPSHVLSRSAWPELPRDHVFNVVGREQAADAQFVASLKQLSYRDLQDLEGAYSEDDAMALDDVRNELTARLIAAKRALIVRFHSAVASHGTMPYTVGRGLSEISARDWIDESSGTPSGRHDYVEMLMDAGHREKALSALASEYANGCAEELLQSGWTA